ncbi:MAG: hypothetical protein M3R52_06950, partial [Acidobacteriota bacterium]|nr:hypothetical protein [Acidobacteriota bacterium]
MVETASDVGQLRWSDLSDDLREALKDKLTGLWGAIGDEQAFDSLSIDKQQALLLILSRLREKGLWHLVKHVINLYGEEGVGIEFTPWPVLESKLARRKDFTRRLAKHLDTTGGFYERGRSEATLHFLYVDQTPPKWYVHFDLYSPVHSASSSFKHFRFEYFRKVR